MKGDESYMAMESPYTPDPNNPYRVLMMFTDIFESHIVGPTIISIILISYNVGDVFAPSSPDECNQPRWWNGIDAIR